MYCIDVIAQQLRIMAVLPRRSFVAPFHINFV